MAEKITIKGRVPSKKNSKQIAKRGSKIFLISSKNYLIWEDAQIKICTYNKVPKHKYDMPLKISYYIRYPDLVKADNSNKIESINDLLVKYGYLLDDNWKIISEQHIYAMGIDRSNPRIELHIEQSDIKFVGIN